MKRGPAALRIEGAAPTMARARMLPPASRNRRASGARSLALALGAVLALAPAASAEAPAGDQAAVLKELFRAAPRAAAAQRLPLGDAGTAHASTAARAGELRAVAARSEPARVLISARSHADVGALAREARALGSDVRVFRRVGVIAVTARSPAELAARLGRDARVAFVELNHVRRISADPADAQDPATGIPFGWAFDFVNAGPAIAAVGGGSSRIVAVIDSGVDVDHPDLVGAVVGTLDSTFGGPNVDDGVGHGTFVSGLISMNADNDNGHRGTGGRTRLFGIRADNGQGEFSTESLIRAKEAAIDGGADILNMSLGGGSISEGEARALQLAFLSDVLPVAASGNGAQRGNQLEFPAAALGGERGDVGIGLSVAAVQPDGAPAPFSTHNRFVSVAAPGAGQGDCSKGVFSSIPANRTLIFDSGDQCAQPLSNFGSGRYAYSEGTSFATPIVSGAAAVAWQAEPRLQSEQVAEVLQLSARQTFGGGGWNEFTGHGVVNAEAAVTEARRYDVDSPRFRSSARRSGRRVRVRVFGGRDRAGPDDRIAGQVRYALALRTRSGDIRFLAGPSRRTITRTLTPRRGVTYLAIACDGNGNCGSKRLRMPRLR